MNIKEGEYLITTNDKGVITCTPKVKSPAACWEDLERLNGYYVNNQSQVIKVVNVKAVPSQCNVWDTKEQALASSAMSRLSQLKAEVNGDWKPDYSSDKWKYQIISYRGKIIANSSTATSHFLCFETEKVAGQFLANHHELIREAKCLL